MATMTVNTPDRNEQPLMTRLLRGFRARIDAFVSSRLRNAVPKATRVEGSRWKQGESFVAQTDQAETPTLELQPLGEDILNAAIPAFFIGQQGRALDCPRGPRTNWRKVSVQMVSARLCACAKRAGAVCDGIPL